MLIQTEGEGGTPGICVAFDPSEEFLVEVPTLGLKKMNKITGAPNESVPHIICSPEESCWLAKIQVFR